MLRPMRVLVVHNRYSSKVSSGENLAVDDEVRWLRAAGVEVTTHEVSNDELFGGKKAEKLRQAAESVWSPSAHSQVAAAIDRAKPDLVHVHNLFPLLTASAPGAATRQDLPVVWTVHNRRLTCVGGTNFRDGAPCQQCRPGWRVAGIRHACYGDSPVASLLITGATALLRRAARRRFVAVAPSEAALRWLVDDAGFPSDRAFRKYNGVEPPDSEQVVAPAAANRVFLFAGHLNEQKGVGLLLDAWRRASLPDDVELRLLGDGPSAGEARAAASADPRIRWLGSVDPKEMPEHLAAARTAVVPSIVRESFGRSAAEASAYRRPVVTTGIGGLSEIVDDESGWVTGTDPDALAHALAHAAADDDAVAARAEAAQRRYLRLFSPEATTRALLDIYERSLGVDGAHVP
jgi:glycosyltransferase involved in cell wall biosynthesis